MTMKKEGYFFEKTLLYVNNDNVTNITDVVTLVNYILSPESSSVDETTYDVDGNGSVNITDVVALVNIILTNN